MSSKNLPTMPLAEDRQTPSLRLAEALDHLGDDAGGKCALGEQSLEIRLALEPELPGCLRAPLAKSPPATGGKILLEGVPDQFTLGPGFHSGNPLRLPQKAGRQGDCDRFGPAHRNVLE